MHTFSISKVITNNDADRIYNHVKEWKIINASYCVTYSFKDLGISKLTLWRIIKETLTIHMLEMTINPNKVIGGSGHSSMMITDMNELLWQEILRTIDSILPDLDNNDERIQKLRNELNYIQAIGSSVFDRVRLEKEILLLQHQYKLRRIDLSCDIVTDYKQEYIRLINMGFPMSGRKMEHKLYDNMEEAAEYNEFEEYEELDVEQFGKPSEKTSCYYSAYWRGKSVNINIYDKYEEMKNAKEPKAEMEEMKKVLRIEVQVKTRKLRNIVRNDPYIESRELLRLATLEQERKLILEYLSLVVRKGHHMKLTMARKIIKSSNHKRSKQNRLINVLKEIQNSGGVEAFLDRVNNGYKKWGELSTIKTYLRDLQDMEINPVLIPDDMKIDQDILHNISIHVQAIYNSLFSEIEEYRRLNSDKPQIE